MNQDGKVLLDISGNSMLPMFCNGDKIVVEHSLTYKVGDVLVFKYKYGEILVHRLLKKCENIFFCKGDNSFRLEDIVEDDIIGKVSLLNNKCLPIIPVYLTDFSYMIGRLFKCNAYDFEKVKSSKIYRFYIQYLWGKNDDSLKFQKGIRLQNDIIYLSPSLKKYALIWEYLDSPKSFRELLNCLPETKIIDNNVVKELQDFLASCILKQNIDIV